MENNYENNVIEPVSKSAKIMGIIGMICGIVGLCSFYGGNIACPIAGLILSNIAKKRGEVKFSKIGKITSVVALILSILAVVVLVAVGFIVGMLEGSF